MNQNNSYIPTEPYDNIRVIRYIKINGCNVIPYKSASFNVDTFTEDKSWVYNRLLNMDTETYLNWNNNDDYAINWILSQLGLTPAPVVQNMNMNYIPLETIKETEPVSPNNNEFIQV